MHIFRHFFRRHGMTLEQLRIERNETYEVFGAVLGCGRESARLYCLPVDDAKYRVAPDAIQRSAYLLSGGRVTPNSFHNLAVWRKALSDQKRLKCEAPAAPLRQPASDPAPLPPELAAPRELAL